MWICDSFSKEPYLYTKECEWQSVLNFYFILDSEDLLHLVLFCFVNVDNSGL